VREILTNQEIKNMKTKIILLILLFTVSTSVCFATQTPARITDFSRYTVVYIKRYHYSLPYQGIVSGHEALLPIDAFLTIKLDPKFDQKTGVITLSSPAWNARAKLGSNIIIINGKREKLSASPKIYDTSPPQIYVPVLHIAKSLGYKIERKLTPSGNQNIFNIVSPYCYKYLNNFFEQVIVSPFVQHSGDIVATAKLILSKKLGDESFYHAYAQIIIKNKGKKTYNVLQHYLYLEKQDERIFTQVFSRYGGSEMYPIAPGEVTVIPFISFGFRVEDYVPIRRIIYTDGWHRFEWEVEEQTGAGEIIETE